MLPWKPFTPEQKVRNYAKVAAVHGETGAMCQLRALVTMLHEASDEIARVSRALDTLALAVACCESLPAKERAAIVGLIRRVQEGEP